MRTSDPRVMGSINILSRNVSSSHLNVRRLSLVRSILKWQCLILAVISCRPFLIEKRFSAPRSIAQAVVRMPRSCGLYMHAHPNHLHLSGCCPPQIIDLHYIIDKSHAIPLFPALSVSLVLLSLMKPVMDTAVGGAGFWVDIRPGIGITE